MSSTGTTAELYAALDRCLAAGETAAVATIVQRKGSTPREVGTNMLIRANGDIDGTVGGGCGEADVWRTAQDVMVDLQPQMVTVDLTEAIALDSDGVCGGIMEIFVEPWASDDGSARGLVRQLLDAVAAKRSAVTATVVSRRGRLPCALGAKLLTVDGAPCAGDLGWAWLQDRVLADLPAVMAEGRSQVRTYVFDAEAPPRARCGGPTMGPLRKRPPHGGGGWGEGPSLLSGAVSVFFEVALPKPVLVVVGAGHVAVPVAEVGRLLDFEVVVIDDRPSFANAARFPMADRIIVDDFEAALDAIPITPSTYVVLVTRGHAHDVQVLRRIVEQPAAYIGMIGSRRRVFAVFKLLHEEGVPIDTLLRVHAPIGLDIDAETPGEIAVSVGAEIMKARRGGRAASLSDRVREQYRASLLKGDEQRVAAR